MMQNQKPEEIAFPSNLRNIKKPKSFNKKQEKSKKSTSKYSEPTAVLKQIEYIPPISNQPEEEYANPSQVQPEKITKQNKRKNTSTPEFEEIQMPLRKSARIPKLSAKALENLVDNS